MAGTVGELVIVELPQFRALVGAHAALPPGRMPVSRELPCSVAPTRPTSTCAPSRTTAPSAARRACWGDGRSTSVRSERPPGSRASPTCGAHSDLRGHAPVQRGEQARPPEGHEHHSPSGSATAVAHHRSSTASPAAQARWRVLKIEGIGGSATTRFASPAASLSTSTLELEKGAAEADLVLVTHEHFDHFGEDDIASVSTSQTVVVGPAEVTGELEGARYGPSPPGRPFRSVTSK